MIKIENVSVAGFEAAIRGLRNPKNSWAKSDSYRGLCGDGWTYDPGFIIGPADKELMMKLNRGGPVHAKYRRQIVVWCDITMPSFVWAEFDTYKVGTVRNSCSFMHKGTTKVFEIIDFSFEDEFIEKAFANACPDSDDALYELTKYNFAVNTVIEELNRLRDLYLKTKDDRIFQLIRRLLPSGYNIRATVTFNYEVLAAMYRDRKFHRLEEWRTFCKWAEEELPYSWIFTCEMAPIEKLSKGMRITPVKGTVRNINEWDNAYTKKVFYVKKSEIPDIEKWEEDPSDTTLYYEGEKVGELSSFLEYNPEEHMIQLAFRVPYGTFFDDLVYYDWKNCHKFTVNKDPYELRLMVYTNKEK